tara:strand:+ start:115 stop:735 length:621 start_codon:yes stop_codon:yes gene_type:complete
MSRKKVKYTKDEITNNLYTSGQEFMTEDNKEYIGLYHSYSTGEVYSNAKWNSNTSIKLIKFREISKENQSYKKLKSDLTTRYNSLQPIKIEITQKNINKGYVDRYFALNVVTRIITEITLNQKKQIDQRKIDPNLYVATSLRWYITGNIESLYENGVTIKSVAEKNNDEIKIASKIIPDISNYLQNLTEYYSDTTYIIPKDLNPIG